MSENLIEVADHLIDVCVREVEKYASIRFSHELMADVINSSRLLQEELKSYGYYSEHLDTFTRDDLLDAIGKQFTTLGRWPMNMDGRATSEQFVTELRKNTVAAGCQILNKDGTVKKIYGGTAL